jgi:thiazole synthase ThiGH ThiG subunit
MFIVKTAPSANEETLVRTALLPDQSAGTAVRRVRRVGRAPRSERLALIEHGSVSSLPAAAGCSPSEDGIRREREAA